MSEFRRDPVHGHWTIIAAGRGKRPFEFPAPETPTKGAAADCPLCPGREDRTPPQIVAVDLAGRSVQDSSWSVRVVPNLFPALGPRPADRDAAPDLFASRTGYGTHEVVVESTRHDRGLGALSTDQAVRALEVCRQRIGELAADPRIEYVLLFKNRGRAAGASLTHPHLQIMATPVVPETVERERDAVRRHRQSTGECLFCEIVRRETDSGIRSILDNGEFVAIAPYASRVPFEMMILPRRHRESFVDLKSAELHGLAELLQRAWIVRLTISSCTPLRAPTPRPGPATPEATITGTSRSCPG
jgi:UDPglucose--hexose-1-phosphate uridylyltransferase